LNEKRKANPELDNLLLLAPLELDRAELSGASFIDPMGSIFFPQKIEDTVPGSLIKPPCE
jgi:hypothetical protein